MRTIIPALICLFAAGIAGSALQGAEAHAPAATPPSQTTPSAQSPVRGPIQGSPSRAPVAPVGRGTVLIALRGGLPLQSAGGLFAPGEMTLHEACDLILKAIHAPESHIALDLSDDFHPSLAAAEEIAALLRSRPQGKQLSCLVDNANEATMVLAAACDQVAMPLAGLLDVHGLAISTDYYADALAKVGIRFHAVTSGPAKTAPEVLVRNGPTPVAVNETKALMAGIDAVLLDEECRNHLTQDGIVAARNQAPQTPEIALHDQLVDAALEPGAWLRGRPAPIRTLAPPQGLALGRLSGVGDLMTLWSRLMSANAHPPRPASAVAVVELSGMIVDGDGGIPGSTIAGNQVAQLFDRLTLDHSITAVVVQIDSGGGSAEASDRMYDALVRLAAAKPVVALFDDVAASGAYYVACAARRILVHPGTITGSIGVFALVPDLEGTRALLGIHRYIQSTGPRADIGLTGPMTPDKEKAIRQVVDATDHRFQSLVAEHRHLSAVVVRGLAGGRVFTGAQAITNGLADGFGTLPIAIRSALDLAGVKGDLPVEYYPHAHGLSAMLGLGDGLVLAGVAPWVSEDLLVFASLARRQEPIVMAWMPWNLDP